MSREDRVETIFQLRWLQPAILLAVDRQHRSMLASA
jgi:hypothetical protein